MRKKWRNFAENVTSERSISRLRDNACSSHSNGPTVSSFSAQIVRPMRAKKEKYSGSKACKSCRSHLELSNEYFEYYFLAKFGGDTAENEPYHLAEKSE